MTPTATATLTKQLIDSMIDQAHADNLLAGYVIIIGHAPLTSRARDDRAATPIREGWISRRRGVGSGYFVKPTFSMCRLSVGVIVDPVTFLFIR